MPICLVRNDITKMKVDAIVNSANPLPIVGKGVDGCIHKIAGKELLIERERIGKIATGEARITKGYHLPAKYVIHTVGPKARDKNMEKLLENCYWMSLELAKQYQCESIAFPLISTGIYGVNKEIALQIATRTIQRYLEKNDLFVYLVVFDQESYQISKELYVLVQAVIDQNLVDELEMNAIFNETRPIEWNMACLEEKHQRSLSDLINEMDDTFSEALLRLIDEKGLTDPTVYKKANIDRRLFSKIRNHPDYQPSKGTALALAFALELNLDETIDLLQKAGYALTHSNKMDIIIEYFIENENYNIYELNEVLFAFNQPTLGG